MTEKYIKMCRKAKEIQKQIPYKIGDIVIFNSEKKNNLIGMIYNTNNYEHGIYLLNIVSFEKKDDSNLFHLVNSAISKVVWLPSIEQLFEILDWSKLGSCREILSNMVAIFYLESDNLEEYWKSFRDMQELLLAFIYYRKYGKLWNGDVWKGI